MAKKTAFGLITILFLISIGGSLPIIYFDLIEPRLGLMNANIAISGLEIAAVDDLSVTFAIKLRIMGPFDKNVILPKLDLTAYAGVMPMGVAWTPMEFTIQPFSFLLPSNAFLYLRVLRGKDSGVVQLFDALLHESNLPISLVGDAYIGSLQFPMPPMTFSLTSSVFDPQGLIREALGIEEEDEDMIEEFLNYLEENGVNLDDFGSEISMDAMGLINFLERYGLNIFAIFFYMDVGREWTEGFNVANDSKIENYQDRIGVQQAIQGLLEGNPKEDIFTNMLKIAWDLDDTELFNGTPWSRADNINYTKPFTYDASGIPTDYYFNESYDPRLLYDKFFGFGGFNLGMDTALRDQAGGVSKPGKDVTFLNITPQKIGGNEYDNDTTEVWDIIPGVNYSLDVEDEEKTINYIRLGFYSNMPRGPLDIEGDGNISTFNADNLSIYDLRTYNPLDPEASLLVRYDEDNEAAYKTSVSYFYEDNEFVLLGWPLWANPPPFGLGRNTSYFTPWLPTDAVKLVFKTNGTNSDDFWGFRIQNIGLDFDTVMEDCVIGNYTPTEGADRCFELDNDTFNYENKQNFNPSAYLLYDLWHQAYSINQTTGWTFENAWGNLTYKDMDILDIILTGVQNPIGNDFTADGMSFWDLIWWLNYHYDLRYLLECSGSNEGIFFQNLAVLMNPTKQADLFYGDLQWWINSTHSVLLKNISDYLDVADFPTMSPAHAFVDFAPGALFENMSEALSQVKIWERNNTSGEMDIMKIVNHSDYYDVADTAGSGGPYASDASYMKALKYHDLGYLDNLKFLALTQDSRDPTSIWQMMYNATKTIMGAAYNETEMDITNWNTKPLPVDTFVQAITIASEEAGGDGGGGISSLLTGIDLLEVLEYITNQTGTTLGDIFDAAGIEVYDLITYFAENIQPTFPPMLLNVNEFNLTELAIILAPAIVAAVAIIIYVSVRKSEGSESSKTK